GVPATPENLAWRAADLLREEIARPGGVRIRIDKAIPVGAGLGGGSADAAAVLLGAARLWGARLGRGRLARLATTLGMDVPFFLGRSPALARGRGETLRPLTPAADVPLVVVSPGIPLATREVYARVEPVDYGDGRATGALVRALGAGITAIAARVTNGLERAAARLWPGLAEVKAALLEAGCLAAVMSGSGSAVVGIAPTARAACRIRDRLAGRPWRVWATRTVSGPALTIGARERTGDGPGARAQTTWGVAKR